MSPIGIADILTIRRALEGAATTCRYHGQDFTRLGMQYALPRCESCQQPFRVVQALAALHRIETAQ